MPLKVSEVAACDGCPMRRLFPDNTFVAPAINDGTRLVIGEAPGEMEQALGEPLVGPTGSWLRGKQDENGEWHGGLLGRAGIRDKEVSRANTIQCRPPDNSYPTDNVARSYISAGDAAESVEHCYTRHLVPLLQSRAWKRIDLLGSKATEAVAKVDGGVMRWRGSPLSCPELGPQLIAVPTIHPAALARDQSLLPVVVSDLKKSLVQAPENYSTHPTLEEVREFTATNFAFDIENDPTTRAIVCVGLCARSGTALCVPYGGAYTGELRRIFQTATEVVGHNCLQHDLPILREHGITIAPSVLVHDTMLYQHLLQPDLPHDLGFLGSIFTNKPAWKHLHGADEELYCCRDTDVTWQCYLQLRPLCKAEHLLETYERISRPMGAICLQMHQLGIQIDPTRIGVVRDKLLEESGQLELRLPEVLKTRKVPRKRRELNTGGVLGKSGKPLKYVLVDDWTVVVPWRSPEVLGEYLYDQLKLPEQLHAKSQQRTCDKTALARLESRLLKGRIPWNADKSVRITPELATQYAGWIHAVQRLTKLGKLLSSFLKAEMLNVERVYPHYNVHGTNCLAPSTRVCTTDLRWVPIENVREGDVLIGFDENGPWRKIRPSTVIKKETHLLDSYRIIVGGQEIVASDKHGWLVEVNVRPKGQGRFVWRHTKDLKPGDRLANWFDPWETKHSRDAGYLAGFLDGEGNFTTSGGLFGTQKENACLAEVRNCLNREQISFTNIERKDSAKPDVKAIYIKNGLRVVGQLRPARLLNSAERTWNGKSAYARREKAAAIVSEVVPIGKRIVIGLSTSTNTFVAEGLLSHNSGRLSSSEPNLQNIPEAARYVYVPSHPTWRFLEADFSQLENRLTAWFAQDTERLARLGTPGFSEHKWLASNFFAIPYDEVEKDNDKDAPYGKAKRIGHGTNYGMGAKKIALLYDMDIAEVKRLLEQWRVLNDLTVKWQTRTSELAKSQGFLVNPFGRKRWFYTDSWYTESLSFLPQSTGADIIHRAAIALSYNRIGLDLGDVLPYIGIVEALPAQARLVAQVHDSLLFEFPGELATEVAEVVGRVMAQPWRELGGMHIPVEMKLGAPGSSWGELESFSLES